MRSTPAAHHLLCGTGKYGCLEGSLFFCGWFGPLDWQFFGPDMAKQVESCPNPRVYYTIQLSGKRLHNYGKSPLLMGKSTISMAMFKFANC